MQRKEENLHLRLEGGSIPHGHEGDLFTLACSVTAKILLIPIAQVKAGVRSFDMTMPDERPFDRAF